MLGHVASSVGNALPGGGGAPTFVGQILLQTTVQSNFYQNFTVPENSLFVFAELVGAGGNNASFDGGGAGANDAILPVTPNETLNCQVGSAAAGQSSTADPTILRRGTTILLQASAGLQGTVTSPTIQAPSKYLLGAVSKVAGGRLAGVLGNGANATTGRNAHPGGFGAAAVRGSITYQPGGNGIALFTFFTNYEAALAFANSVLWGLVDAMTDLYRQNGSAPAPLPSVAYSANGDAWTDLANNPDGLAACGFVLAPDQLDFDPATQAVRWDGDAWVVDELPPQPAPGPEMVTAERDRRIDAGIVFSGHRFQSRSGDRENIAGAAQLAFMAIVAGAQPGDLRWADSDNDFVWIAEDNSLVPMDAPTVIAFAKTAAGYKQALTMTARAIKDIDPIPDSFAEDALWPAQ